MAAVAREVSISCHGCHGLRISSRCVGGSGDSGAVGHSAGLMTNAFSHIRARAVVNIIVQCHYYSGAESVWRVPVIHTDQNSWAAAALRDCRGIARYLSALSLFLSDSLKGGAFSLIRRHCASRGPLPADAQSHTFTSH